MVTYRRGEIIAADRVMFKPSIIIGSENEQLPKVESEAFELAIEVENPEPYPSA